jgi:benzoate transport
LGYQSEVMRTPQDIIEKEPMGLFQYTAITICVLLNALDGFDVLSISFASPGIASEWGISRATLGFVLSMELFGMALGSIVIGPYADRHGRRPTILLCLVVMAAGMFMASTANSVSTLSAYRFCTGIGIGGMLAAINAMTAEYSNARFRNLSVIIMATGYPVGVIIGGSIAASLLGSHDWRSVFQLGAAATVVFLPIVWFLLPESIEFLNQKRPQNALERINKTLSRMGHDTIAKLPEPSAAIKSGIRQLLSGRLRRITLLLTVAYFAHIMTFYFILKWIPKLVVDMGFHASEAGSVLVWANVGGAVGSIALGLLTQKFPVRILLIIALSGAAIAVNVFGQGSTDIMGLALVGAMAGMFTNSAIVAMYAMFAQSFPTELRATGTGFIIGLGRGGAALGPIIAGLMFQADMGLDAVAFVMACGSVVAAIAVWLLGRQTT